MILYSTYFAILSLSSSLFPIHFPFVSFPLSYFHLNYSCVLSPTLSILRFSLAHPFFLVYQFISSSTIRLTQNNQNHTYLSIYLLIYHLPSSVLYLFLSIYLYLPYLSSIILYASLHSSLSIPSIILSTSYIPPYLSYPLLSIPIPSADSCVYVKTRVISKVDEISFYHTACNSSICK